MFFKILDHLVARLQLFYGVSEQSSRVLSRHCQKTNEKDISKNEKVPKMGRPMSFSGSEYTIRRIFYARSRGNIGFLPNPCFS